MNTRSSKLMHVTHGKARVSRNVRHACFTLKRPVVFQVRKSLAEYVDEELMKLDTSVFYQRIFILAKNVELKRDSVSVLLGEGTRSSQSNSIPAARSLVDGDTATLRTAEPIMADEDKHYSQVPTPTGSEGKMPIDDPPDAKMTVKIIAPLDPEVETVTRTFRFDEAEQVVEEQEVEVSEPEPESQPTKRDIFAQFTEHLQELQVKCRQLSYSPDPVCGLVIYMNEYTMMMLESGEDMIGIFCRELLEIVPSYWQSNRIFHIEDNIKETYTKDLLFRRIPAAFLNEKFPPSTPTDEYLMGKQHLIIKEKLCTICTLVGESVDTARTTESSHIGSLGLLDGQSEVEGENIGMDDDNNQPAGVSLTQCQRQTVAASEALPADVFRKLLPEIQRIELVLSSTRFYYTLDEFCSLYGKVPIRPDDDGCFWPIQNNYTPANIFRRLPFDINLTFTDYAAEMNRRMQEEQEKDKAEKEAAAAAEASHADQSAAAARPQKAKEEEAND